MRAFLVLILLASCATTEPSSPVLPVDIRAPSIDEVTAEFMGEAMKAQAIINRLQRERDEARDIARTCEQARST